MTGFRPVKDYNVDTAREIMKEIINHKRIEKARIYEDWTIEYPSLVKEYNTKDSSASSPLRCPCLYGPYYDNKNLILDIFRNTKQCYGKKAIMARLIILDACDHTNTNKMFVLEDLADAILSIGDENYFISLCEDLVEYHSRSNKVVDLFKRTYGLSKNLDKGNFVVSLLSKYIFMELKLEGENFPFGFPIWDNLRDKSNLAFCDRVLFWGHRDDIISIYCADIIEYIVVMDRIRSRLFDKFTDGLFYDWQQYEILDTYLQIMGSISNGELYSLMNRQQYEQFIKNFQSSGTNTRYWKRIEKQKQDIFTLQIEEQPSKSTSELIIQIRKHILRYTDLHTLFNGFGNDEQYFTKIFEHWKRYYWWCVTSQK
jgi:hypothetical protein